MSEDLYTLACLQASQLNTSTSFLSSSSSLCPTGYFTQISTLADVQENVMEYLHVLSRPKVIDREHDTVWTEAYIDNNVSFDHAISHMVPVPTVTSRPPTGLGAQTNLWLIHRFQPFQKCTTKKWYDQDGWFYNPKENCSDTLKVEAWHCVLPVYVSDWMCESVCEQQMELLSQWASCVCLRVV